MFGFVKTLLPSKVKTKLLVILGILITVMIVIPVIQIYTSTIRNALSSSEMSLRSTVFQVRDKMITDKLEQLTLVGVSVVSMPSVQDNVKFQSRSDLLDITQPLLERLRKTMEVDVFAFHLPPAKTLLRVEKPDQFDDDVSAIYGSVVEANTEGKQVVGLEMGENGLALRSVVPVLYLNRKHAGTLLLEAPLNDGLAEEIKQFAGMNISLVIPTADGFRYQAKTHNLSIPEGKYPALRKILDSGELTVQRVSKNGRDLMTAYLPIQDYTGRNVAILALPKDISSVLAAAKRSALTFAGVGLVALIVIQGIVYLLFHRLIDRNIKQLTTVLESASRGDLTVLVDNSGIAAVDCSSIMDCGATDCSMYGKKGYCWEEAGSASTHVQCPKILSGEYSSCSECRKVFGNAVQDEFSELNAYIHAFMGNVRSMVMDIRGSSTNLNGSADNLRSVSMDIDEGTSNAASRAESVAAAAEEMSSNMSTVAVATEQAAANVKVMTSATEEISTSVANIEHSTTQAKSITTTAVNEAGAVSTKVDELGSAAHDIGKVTETIAEISEQTNLLALNATIEAARAGEAGKGFAVVANEIKELARQTAEATGEIKQRIDGIQNSTEATVDGIRTISDIITEIDTFVGNITTAVEEQSSVMAELVENISETGEGISEVAGNVAQSSRVSSEIAVDIAQVNQTAEEISSGTGKILENGEELKRLADQLQNQIEKFKV